MNLIPWYFRLAPTAPVTDAFPALSLHIAFTTDPTLEVPVWVDVTQWWMGDRPTSIRRQRPNELSRVEAGVLNLTLNNKDRRFEPEYSLSPYFPNVLPLRRVRLTAAYGASVYPLFSGYVEQWPRVRPNAATSEIQITAIDGLAVLALSTISGEFPEELTSDRVNRVLDLLGWPVVDRFVLPGLSTVAAVTIDPPGVAALQHLQEIADTENGVLFCDGEGKLTFHDRHARIRDFGEVTATFGDNSDTLPYTDIVPTFDIANVYNHATVTTAGEHVGESADLPSQEAYFVQSLSRRTHLVSEAEADDAASFLVSLYKEPTTRYERMVLEPQMAPTTLWPQVLGDDISTRLQISEQPPGGGGNNIVPVYLEGIQHDLGYRAWRTTWTLSPAETQSTWVLEHPQFGTIDTTNKLAY